MNILHVPAYNTEEGQERKSKLSGADSSESKRALKNMETQLRELERRCRAKDVEIERLKQKLAHVAEKERENNARNRTILSQIKSGDMSFMSDKATVPVASSPQKASAAAAHNTSFHSAGGKSASSRVSSATKSSTSPNAAFVTATTVVSLTAVVDALESQRKELVVRNKELELQVRDLLLSLKKAQNANTNTESRSRGADAWADAEEGEEGPSSHSRGSSKGGHYQQQDGATRTPTAQSMYQRIQQQEGEIEALLRQLELNSALLTERDETIAAHRDRWVGYINQTKCWRLF